MNRFLKPKIPTKEAANRTTSPAQICNANQPSFEEKSTTGIRSEKSPLVRSLRRLLSIVGDPPLKFVLPDNQVIAPNEVQLVGTIKIRDYRTIWSILLDPLFQFGEAYADGRIEIEGDLRRCLTVLYLGMSRGGNIHSTWQSMLSRLRRPRSNSLKGSQQNISQHYDIGNEFYRLWLDENMLYTCAYFARPSFTLEQAQIAKMDHVCRKLRLRPGMEVVEAGCGWGALAIHMAKHYGVRVKAFNISQEQVAWANETARQEGLADQAQFIQEDWRAIGGKFDAFVSVGMLEHVGAKNYRQLGTIIQHCLKPQGIGLIHTIGQNSPVRFNPWIEKRIFPGAYPPSLKELMQVFEPNSLSVLDVENLRLHYAETLRHWLDRFEDATEEVQDQFGERFVRMWRMYLAGSCAAFETGYLQLFQVVFADRTSNNVPRTREHLYGRLSEIATGVFEHSTQ